MEAAKLKKFAQNARRSLIEQVSAKLDLVLAEDSAARRESADVVRKLEEAIAERSEKQVTERVAYIWFNRFCALRFMDVNRYTRVGVVSPAEGQFQPEMLADAKSGHIDDDMAGPRLRQKIFDLLGGRAPSRDPQSEAYCLLLVAACNYWHEAMPFLFQRIDDYTELLMPDDLLSGNSILANTREAMTPDACKDVEVIGWLYQYYISEKKDEVFAGLKKNKKSTPENIPAATQLFTPHWIVRYLVENSLGRLWMLNRPSSKLIEKMDYYIKPEQLETDFLCIDSPEEIRICDPACGSGHMLTYAFDLLYAIYEEEGYEPTEIPENILTHNLYGIEIDERAGELAAFALTMKARASQRRFFSKGIKPNICVIEAVRFEKDELDNYMDFIGRDLFTASLQTTLSQFEEADNFGSLIRPVATDVFEIHRTLETRNVSDQLFLSATHGKVLKVLRQTDYLRPKYHVVIANPPYMGSKGMGSRLAAWLKRNYTDVKADLFSAFIVRNTELALPGGQLGFMSPFVWMFISTYEKLRSFLINQKTITSLVQLEYSGFDGATVPICTFTIENAYHPDFRGGYVRLSDFRGSENQGPRALEAINNPDCGWFHRASATDFKKIPGSPIAYWVSDQFRRAFSRGTLLQDFATIKHGLSTGKNEAVVRAWSEVCGSEIGLGIRSRDNALLSGKKWFPYNKGGDYRKWYGNCDFVLRYDKYGNELMSTFSGHRHDGKSHYFLEGVSYTKISSSSFSARYTPPGFVFDDAGSSVFCKHPKKIIAFLSTNLCYSFLKAINPTLNFQVGNLKALPLANSVIEDCDQRIGSLADSACKLSSLDWNSYERSWDFKILPLLNSEIPICNYTLAYTYKLLRTTWRNMALELKRLEEENNRIHIECYGLQDELDPRVPLKEITLTCNPYYRYNADKSDEELEELLLADTMREFVSYAVGCMLGRYALEKRGLILANEGESIEDYLNQIPKPLFPADNDNVIPMLNGDWFTDDIVDRFREFLRITFGEEHYEENLRFVEQALNVKGKRDYSIRDFFLNEFYADHIKRYKKRPIYWLFSSPKGSFNALIYMHRYRPDTVSVVLNDYLREFRTKLTSYKNHLEAVSISAGSSQGEKTRALKEIEKTNKMITEMEEYERDILYPLATQQIEIDLDDGVKANYPKFGKALKKVPGLSTA